jgi:hypothetical protein
MQARCARPIESKAADKDYARDRIRGLRKTCPRQVVVNKALGREAPEQPLYDSLLKVELNDFLSNNTRVLEDHRTNG